MLGVLSTLALATGCGTAPVANHVVRDSAGVRIVENRSSSGVALRLDSLPSLEIGPGGGPTSEFISPISAVRRADGWIVAAGWAMTELQVFDAAGRWRRTVGRRGSGPGEFEALGFVFQAAGGDLVTFEPGAQRVQRWSSSADFQSLAVLTSPGGRPTAAVTGVFEDHSLLLSLRAPDEAAGTPVTSRQRIALFRAQVPEGQWDSLFSYLGRPAIRHPQNPAWSAGAPLFTPGPSLAQRGRRLAFTPGDRFEVQIWNERGELEQVIRRPAEPRAITPAEFERALQAVVESFPEDLREPLRERYRRASTSRMRPPVAGVWLTEAGRVWAATGDSALGERPRASVFDSLGHWEADIELPHGFRISQVGEDGVLGTARDADGFYRLRFYRLRRGSG